LGSVFAQEAPPGEIVAAGLDAPRGLHVLEDGSLLIAEGGGRVIKVGAGGSIEVVTDRLPSAVSSALPAFGGIVVVVGEGDATSAFQSLYLVENGVTTKFRNMQAAETANNYDGDVDRDGNPEVNSNPFDATSDGAGGMFITDSGANTVFHLAEDGTLTPYAIFTNRENPLFGTVGGPTMDQVPTGITRGPDGAVYITTLTGFPFPPGAGRVYRLADGNGDGDALDDGEATIWAEGFTMATDLAFDSDGSLLVTQFSLNNSEDLPGSLVRVTSGVITTEVSGLISPTSVAIGPNGEIYVSQEFAGLVTEVSGVDDAAPPAAGPSDTGNAPGPSDTGNAGLTASSSSQLALLVAALAAAMVVVAGRKAAQRPRRVRR
jgi:glucose/arabinose dehydrogenase